MTGAPKHGDRPVRVLVNALHAKTGGGVTYLRNILPLLVEDPRLELHLFLLQDQIELFHPLDERIVLHVFAFTPGWWQMLLWEQAAVPVLARVMSADVVFSPANFGVLALSHQVILLRNAVEVGRHERRWSKRLYWIALMLMTLGSVARCRRVMAVSRYARDALTMGIGHHKTEVVYHGVSPLFQPRPEAVREDFVLAVLDIYIQKNLHNLVEALTLVVKRKPNLRLLIAGSVVDQWYHQTILTQLTERGLGDNITFLGRQTPQQLADLYQRCALFVFPSSAETFGMPLVEGMACGAPIVSSNSTAMPEILGSAAQYFDPLSPTSIADAIFAVLDNPARTAELSALALERSRRFSWQSTAESTAAVLLSAAKGH